MIENKPTPMTPTPAARPSRSRLYFAFILFAGLTGAVVFMLYLLSAPKFGELPRTFTIEPGMSVGEIATKAKAEGFVHSSLVLYAMLTYFHEPTELFAGTYMVEEELSVADFAAKLAAKDIVVDNVAIMIPEGTRVTDIAAAAARSLTGFDENEFIAVALPQEGYLFPETYHIPAHFTEVELSKLMRTTFDEKTLEIRNAMMSHPLGEYGVLILASIIEREANDPTSMKMVSGILQNRMREAMPLQADASIEYALDKPLKELTPDDLKRDTPYNTYLYRGLPPTPIGNPGLEAIKAVLEPTKSDYFFYITTDNGTFYYARTFDEHRTNIEAYLR